MSRIWPVALLVVFALGCHRQEQPPHVRNTISNSPVSKPLIAPKPKFEKPKSVRGIYVTAWVAGGKERFGKLLELADKTEINSFVIDIRDEGQMYIKTGLKLADDSKANRIAMVHPERVLEALSKHRIWPIARIAMFRDNFVAVKHPNLAVQTPNGKVWRDRSGHAWLDPYNKTNWKYMEDTVIKALDLGFPEIQLDYVRFPSEGDPDSQRYPSQNKYSDRDAEPADVIQAFAKHIGEVVHARKAVYSADIFGIISSKKSDQGIGQLLEKVAEPFDVISPMIYPSHFHLGEYGISDPDQAPYAIITKSLGDFKKRLPKKEIRPWLQSFSLRNKYGKKEIRAQIRAANDLGYSDWLMWNAAVNYPADAFEKE